jgi:hypothetical protein
MANTLLPQTGKAGSKMVYYLGTGMSFNVTEYKGWEKFTSNNFIVGISDVGYARFDIANVNDAASEYSGLYLAKSYANGILTLSACSHNSFYNASTLAMWNGWAGNGPSGQTGATYFAYLVVDA